MSEDKMRDEFEKAHLHVYYQFDRRNSANYANSFIQAKWEAWEACAAIKDAEIASLHLTIKELREDIMRAVAAMNLMGFRAPRALTEALAKSEHHNSRALEKMLLEAEIKVLGAAYNICNPYGEEFRFMITEREAKLAELNKEQK